MEKNEFLGIMDLIENTCGRAGMFFVRRFKIACTELNLAQIHGQVLLFLSRQQKYFSQTEICEYIETNASMISRMVDEIEKIGLVRRIVPEENRRAKFVELTDTGQSIAAKLLEKTDDIYFEILKSLDKDEFKMLKVILEKIKRSLPE
jgi:MarR family transcriptional regulator for hemolysin